MMVNIHMILSLVVFVAVYWAISTEIINKAAAALLGGLVMVLMGVLDQESAYAHVDWNVIFLLIGMMIIMSITKRTGIFQYIAIKIAKLSRGEPIVILVALSLITAVVSAFLDNVTTVLIIIPITILIAVELGISPVPFVITLAIASNIGGTATLIGDPPNIMIGSAANLSFVDFIVTLSPVILIILVISSLMVILMFKKQLQVTNERKARVMNFDESKAIEDPVLLVKSMVVLGLVILAFLLHGVLNFEPSTIALTGAVLLIILSGAKELEHIFAEVEWTTIFFFFGLFIVVGALVEVGIMSMVSSWLLEVTKGNLKLTQYVILWVSSIVSAVVDNIPFVATMIPLIKDMGNQLGAEAIKPLWWALSLGACLGGNGTLIGASANVVSAGLSAKSGYPISFWDFTKIGAIFMFMSIIVSSLYIFVKF
ncbi:ArsB/NhaD family transporter [Gracilinema caldarium]|uniref:ArsB/NhaD family transporter n=1 Tax=Gracilinema caldarium TaxID=215591 RepID=UPI0026ED3548|nr:ArsB/NhaD family transporter [Gracilinema caldarium]